MILACSFVFNPTACLISFFGCIFPMSSLYVNGILLVDNRQEYDVREEKRRELEFLEKVQNFDLSFAVYSTPVCR